MYSIPTNPKEGTLALLARILIFIYGLCLGYPTKGRRVQLPANKDARKKQKKIFFSKEGAFAKPPRISAPADKWTAPQRRIQGATAGFFNFARPAQPKEADLLIKKLFIIFLSAAFVKFRCVAAAFVRLCMRNFGFKNYYFITAAKVSISIVYFYKRIAIIK